MHSAIDNPALVDRTFLRAIFEYPFEQCKVEHIIGLVESDNERALQINKRCGFKESMRLSGGGLRGQDLVVMTLRAEDCRWLRRKHGKEVRGDTGGLSRSDGAGAKPIPEYCAPEAHTEFA
jgi:hypothetical protein